MGGGEGGGGGAGLHGLQGGACAPRQARPHAVVPHRPNPAPPTHDTLHPRPGERATRFPAPEARHAGVRGAARALPARVVVAVGISENTADKRVARLVVHLAQKRGRPRGRARELVRRQRRRHGAVGRQGGGPAQPARDGCGVAHRASRGARGVARRARGALRPRVPRLPLRGAAAQGQREKRGEPEPCCAPRAGRGAPRRRGRSHLSGFQRGRRGGGGGRADRAGVRRGERAGWRGAEGRRHE